MPHNNMPYKLEFFRGIKSIANYLGLHEQVAQKKLKAGLIPAKKDEMGRWVLCNLDYYLSLKDEDEPIEPDED